MEPEMLPEQKAQLATWAGKRDILLLEISNLQTVKEKLIVENKEIAASNTDIVTQMNIVKGRIIELNIKEQELPLLVSKEVSSLQSTKNSLETDITNLNKMVGALTIQKNGLETSISFLTETFKSLNDRVGLLETVVGHVTNISDANAAMIETLMTSVKDSLQSIIDVNQLTVEKTNGVISELPKVFLEVQRQSLERQTVNKIKI